MKRKLLLCLLFLSGLLIFSGCNNQKETSTKDNKEETIQTQASDSKIIGLWFDETPSNSSLSFSWLFEENNVVKWRNRWDYKEGTYQIKGNGKLIVKFDDEETEYDYAIDGNIMSLKPGYEKLVLQTNQNFELADITYTGRESDGVYKITIFKDYKCHVQIENVEKEINSDGTYTYDYMTQKVEFSLTSGEKFTCRYDYNKDIVCDSLSLTFFRY